MSNMASFTSSKWHFIPYHFLFLVQLLWAQWIGNRHRKRQRCFWTLKGSGKTLWIILAIFYSKYGSHSHCFWGIKIMETVTHLQDVQSQQPENLKISHEMASTAKSLVLELQWQTPLPIRQITWSVGISRGASWRGQGSLGYLYWWKQEFLKMVSA